VKRDFWQRIDIIGFLDYSCTNAVLGRKRGALVDADGNWLAVAVVPASVQDRDREHSIVWGSFPLGYVSGSRDEE